MARAATAICFVAALAEATTCPESDGTCVCDWANAGTCGADDGSKCNCMCCCGMTGSCVWQDATSSTGGGSVTSVTSNAKTTRYWDCCKPSCAWESNAGVGSLVDNAVQHCDIDDNPLADQNVKNVCGGGGTDGVAYMCTDQQPFAVNDEYAYGFAAANVDCSTCYELEFTTTALASSGKKMIVQVTNKGGDLGDMHFDIQLPGGGLGIFNGCAETGSEPENGRAQFSEPYANWGERYGGLTSLAECAGLPAKLRAGCEFRFGWFENADNPAARATRVQCPAELVAKTGSRRNDDGTYPVISVGATLVPDTPFPATAAPQTPAPTTPSPATASPVTPAPATASPATSAPDTPAPATLVPDTASPATLVPDTPFPAASSSIDASTPQPVTPTPSTPFPMTPTPIESPAPEAATPPSPTAPLVPATPTPTTGALSTLASPTADPTTVPPAGTGTPVPGSDLDSSSNMGLIVGGVVGGVSIVAAAAAVWWYTSRGPAAAAKPIEIDAMPSYPSQRVGHDGHPLKAVSMPY